jgi:hypothetical protein
MNKEVWLTVASGGRWTADEIKRAVVMSGKDLKRALYAMSHGGLLHKYEGSPVRYGVTAECITPRQTSVSEILAAMGMSA